MEIKESGLRFKFNNEWQVIAYDKHKYYQAISGKDMRGVDFIGVFKGEQLVLIEVKHFRNPNGKIPPQHLQLLESPDDFVKMLNKKGEDTLKAIRIIYKALSRKWLFRVMQHWFLRHPVQKSSFRDWHFWAKAYHLAFEQKRVSYLLWLEIDPPVAEVINRSVAKLKEEIMDGMRVLEVDFEIGSIGDRVFDGALGVEMDS